MKWKLKTRARKRAINNVTEEKKKRHKRKKENS